MEIIVSDFDGTLIKRNSLIEFIRFVHGSFRCFWGFFVHLPWLIMMKLGICSNAMVKEKIFAYFFKGMPLDDFKRHGRCFADRINKYRRDDVVAQISAIRLAASDKGEAIPPVYVVTASVEEWVRPWAEREDFITIGTQVEINKSQCLSGKFSSPNCYGEEKVRRLLKNNPCLHDKEESGVTVHAFGDSRGDRELLALADYPHWV